MKEYLKNRRLYLSGPIEHGKQENWRTEPTKVFRDVYGLDVFDPFDDPKQQWATALWDARKNKDYDTMEEISHHFVRKDLAIVDRSDIVVSYLPYGVPTTGTVHEIIISSNAKKPTLLVCPEGREYISFWYYGISLREYMFGSWTELYEYLDDVNAGKHMDNDRWAYVYGLL